MMIMIAGLHCWLPCSNTEVTPCLVCAVMYQYVVESYYYASLDMKERRGVDETLRKEKKKVYKGNEREKKL